VSLQYRFLYLKDARQVFLDRSWGGLVKGGMETRKKDKRVMGRSSWVVISDTLEDPVAHATSEIHACVNHFHCFIKHRKVSLVRTPSALLHNPVFSLVVIHYHPAMASYYVMFDKRRFSFTNTLTNMS